MKTKHDISFSYLTFMNERDALCLEFNLAFKEMRLLRYIVFAYLENRVATVNDILPLINYGSPSTNHSILKKLVSKSFVTTVKTTDDQRVKNLIPSEKTLVFFDELSRLFRKYSALD